MTDERDIGPAWVPTVEEAHAKTIDRLAINGTAPESFSIVDVTPEGHATSLFAVVMDCGWAITTVTDGCYKRVAEGIAIALAQVCQCEVKGIDR